MRNNDADFLKNVIGMPRAHAEAFKTIAKAQRCVIMVRATGPTCHGLLEEGYDTKGYRIHGKSCNWGPMAGFVMRDPRLNKAGMEKAAFNTKKHNEALYNDEENQGWTASTTPLIISAARVGWLQGAGHLPDLRSTLFGYTGTASAMGVKFNYALVRSEGSYYRVCLDHTKPDSVFKQTVGVGNATDKRPDHEPLLAMTNPPDHCGLAHGSAEYLKAVTGDYDLFAVWPYVKAYNADAGGDDHRPLGTVKGSVGKAQRANVDRLERNFVDPKHVNSATGIIHPKSQGTKLGNITNRIYMICQMINSIVGRQVLWHSDEAARPFVDDVDLPVIAFNPAGTFVGIETINDFKAFIKQSEALGIQVLLSNAWAQDASAKFPNRLGASYEGYVPSDGTRVVVPGWYNE